MSPVRRSSGHAYGIKTGTIRVTVKQKLSSRSGGSFANAASYGDDTFGFTDGNTQTIGRFFFADRWQTF